ncbi:Sec63 Brl domain-domain-containing protein [Naematelia encephala]|uniref:Sec63 Brl domain-domain-containing protein n=1 Tax=Naematelia encephala TaxID=71784 RepID=A0A1Y2B9X7_9TREE|nr:Sec63 Brl domain-domain-containing protein [Naematelia encephala]
MSLTDHLEDLLQSDSPSRRRDTPSVGTNWQTIIEEWEATHGPSSPAGPSTLTELTASITPWPSLLNFYDLPSASKSSPPAPNNGHARHTNGHQASASEKRPVDPNLPARVKSHLPASTAYNTLIHLLSTSRTNEDIQSELVEILGFEGQGLELVEELLQPGARDTMINCGELESGSSTPNGSRARKGQSSRANYLPSARITLTAAKGREKKQYLDIADIIGSTEDIERRLQEQLERPKAMFSEGGPRLVEQEALPNVFQSGSGQPAAMSQGGRFALPSGTTREIADTYEEVTIPPSKPLPPKRTERPIKISELSPLARGCFPNYVTLNRMQSIIQPTAMNTNENLLICAPTGAGKTDVALMSILRVLEQYTEPGPSTHPSGFSIHRDAFKIIYVAPMKALAAEITRKFGKRLAWLGIKVRELTGDMQLTRQEIADTQVIVTTPEKWDVVTRKPTREGELASKVRLLIIDEVHLLNEERGAVIETIVARTLRQVESSQSLIRIVGLSATLPNYIDVSDFLRVNRYQGLFFFDASFRPVPLEQHFIGVVGKPRSQAAIRNMDRVVFDKVAELVQDGHQVMVFVHARKETVKSAQNLLEMAKEEGMTSFFDPREHPKFDFYRRDIGTSRNKEMKELFDSGFGIHHAGMLRSDRNMMERMFEDQAIKVLCCTSTLAWGVNLPAHAVIIKGTQVYDSSKGAFVDLSVLDVLQIFGRAGRPGYETSGVGYICTTGDKLDHYLQTIMAQHPIESKFIPGMIDSLNAEISLGTISNVAEAIEWLGYTYLFVRMRKEPFIYGMSHDEPVDDPQIGKKRLELVMNATRQLQSAKMVRFDEGTQAFAISDLGRIAAKYYLKYQTLEIFNEKFHAKMKNADLFVMLSHATEFEQIQIRESENEELTAILESDHVVMEVKDGTTSKQGKVNILLQAYISKVFIEDFALVSDSAYVAQNAARIIRALLEIALSRNWANCAVLLIDLSKAIEQRMWPFEHPLLQITTLQRETLHNLKRWAEDTEVADLRLMEPKDIAEMIHMNEKHGTAIRDAAVMFPTIAVTYKLRPLAHDLLQITVHVKPTFKWDAKISTSGEPFYVWIQDAEGYTILQWRFILLRPATKDLDLDFVIPVGDTIPPSLTVISASDRWMGSHSEDVISLEDLVMPAPPQNATPLLDLPFLRTATCFDDQQLQQAYRGIGIDTLNGVQTQAFWSVHTQMNVLVSAPVASGKSFLGEAAIQHALKTNNEAVVLVIVPQRHFVQETTARIRSVYSRNKNVHVNVLINPADFAHVASAKRSIFVTSPTSFLRVDEPAINAALRAISLVVLEDLHLLDDAYELTVARTISVTRPAKTRVVGLTSSLNDPSDLASWLGVDPAFRFIFYPRDRGNPIPVHLKTFTIPHSSTLLKVMVKPTYDVIKSSPSPTIIFVPSRSACRTVAADLVTQSGTEMDLNGFLTAPREDVEPLVQRLRDPGLFEPILHGIGYIVPTMPGADLALVLELFASGILRALIVPREACWTLPVRAETVVVMATQYIRYSGEGLKGDRQVVNYTRQELVRMQGFAVLSASPSLSGGRLFIMCQTEHATLIGRVLSDGLPLESSMPLLIQRQGTPDAMEGLRRMLKPRAPPPPPQLHRPRVPDLRKRDILDLLGWTYFAWRVRSNPTYYDMPPERQDEQVSRLVDKWWAGQAGEYGQVNMGNGSTGGGSARASRVGESSAGWGESQVEVGVRRETAVGMADGEEL